MSIFDVNFYTRKKEYHRYSSDDIALSAVGISSYTTSSLERFFKNDNPDVIEFFGDTQSTKRKLLGVGRESSMKIFEFDINDKIFKPTVGFSAILRLDAQKYPAGTYPPIRETTIAEFLAVWNSVQLGTTSEQTANSYRAVIAKIHNSQKGYIEFTNEISVLRTPKTISIRLDLMNIRDGESAKTVSLKGSPLITAVPSTPAGLKYAHRPTVAAEIGSYISPVGDGVDNPQNTASGPLSLVWDPSTGEFQSGTQQILVRILTDIDPANVRDFTFDELESFTNEDIYSGPDGLGFMGNFTKGEAIPLSAENGNPYLFGPDFKGVCQNATTDKVKITVINRLNFKYKAGSVAVASRMAGENGNWVLVSQGTPADDTIQKNINFGNFEYQQHIIPANEYFTFKPTQEKLMPDTFMSWCRSSFYLDGRQALEDNIPQSVRNYDLSSIIKLNLVASSLSSSDENPIETLTQTMKDQNAVNQFINQANIEKNKFAQIDLFLSANSAYTNYIVDYGLPINILEKSARRLQLATSLDGEALGVNSQDPLYALEVPMFWGMCFPDGFKTDGVKSARSKITQLQNFEIYRNDPNLKELSVAASQACPYLGNDLNSNLFGRNIGINFIKKTGGIFTSRLCSYLSLTPNMYNNLYNYISLNAINQSVLVVASSIDEYPYGLEPINPKRIQFSPMCINQLFSASELGSFYGYLRDMQTYLKNSTMINQILPAPNLSINFQDYAKQMLLEFDEQKYPAQPLDDTSFTDNGNSYNLKSLVIPNSFSQATANRHAPPAGTAFQIIPPILNFRRSVVMPVLTCKSKIKTSSDGLAFTVNQSLGMSPQITISPSYPPRVIVLPIGAGIGWTDDPGNPGKQNSVPQWGDRNRTDDIDSFGTSALHVRVFEGWPQNQTIYYGPLFTPLHFNPSAPTILKKLEYNDDGEPVISPDLDSDGNTRFAISDVDFRIPTDKDGVAFRVGNVVTQENLAPQTEWLWNGVRRAALLSGGGFAYYRNYIGINPSNQIVEGGSGYTQDDTFLFADGTSFQVNVGAEGKITGIKADSIIEGTNGITSVPANDLQPRSQGSGSGAVFGNPQFVIRQRIGYDPAPKEVVPITRLTKPSNLGEKIAEGVVTTNVVFSDTNKKDFDIFYFFHNDPTHFSVDKFLPFDGGFAQYAIVEVNGI
jgi:hypothetical protein